jgi:uncharacterized protein
MRCLVIVLLVVACLFGANSALALTVEDVPPLSEVENGKVLFVLDDAEVLSNSTEATLTKELQQLAQDKHIQVRVLTVKRIEFGQPAQEFVDQVFDKWFPTPEAKANQALLLVAVEDHRTAIARGEAVAEVVPQAILQSIVSTNVLYPVQQANYNQAVLDGINRLMAVAYGKPDPGEPVVAQEPAETRNYAKAEETDVNSSTLIVVVLLFLATVIPMVTYYWFQNQN